MHLHAFLCISTHAQLVYGWTLWIFQVWTRVLGWGSQGVVPGRSPRAGSGWDSGPGRDSGLGRGPTHAQRDAVGLEMDMEIAILIRDQQNKLLSKQGDLLSKQRKLLSKQRKLLSKQRKSLTSWWQKASFRIILAFLVYIYIGLWQIKGSDWLIWREFPEKHPA